MESLRREQRELNRDADWRNRAACLSEDPELFFPIGNSGPAKMQIAEAKTVCRGCEVRETCLQWALDHDADFGVFGGGLVCRQHVVDSHDPGWPVSSGSASGGSHHISSSSD